MTGAAQITAWFPSVDQWVVALVIVVVLGGINLLAAGEFGRVESGVACRIESRGSIFFAIVGLGLLVGIIPGSAQEPAGIRWKWWFLLPSSRNHAVGLLAINTSFGGLEIVTIAAAEADDANARCRRAIRS